MAPTDERFWLAARDRIRVIHGEHAGQLGTVSTVAGTTRDAEPSYHVQMDNGGWAVVAWNAMELVSRPADSPRGR